MRLLYVHGSHLDSNSANVVQVVNMCEAFAQCGAEVTLAIASPQKKSVEPLRLVATHLGQEPTFKIVTYQKYTIAGRLVILGNYLGVRSLLRNCKANLCFVRDPLILHLSIKASLPTVFESHNKHLHDRYQLLGQLWERSLLAKTKNPKLIRFVTISQALADVWCEKGVPKHKILALHDGFNHHLFEVVKDKAEGRKTLGLPQAQKIVVYAGSLKPDRGIERIPRLAKEFTDVLFLVVGGPENRRLYYEEMSKREGVENIQWEGHVPHASITTYLHAADVLLMLWTWDVPTIKICSPMKIFEYMASERIIVGEKFPTFREVLLDGETAYLADPDSFGDLRNKLRQALSQTYPSAMATKARKLALEEYSWNTRAQKILESVEGLV